MLGFVLVIERHLQSDVGMYSSFDSHRYHEVVIGMRHFTSYSPIIVKLKLLPYSFQLVDNPLPL